MVIGGLDDEKAMDKVLGDEFAHILIDEASQTTWAAYQTCVTRLAQKIPGEGSQKHSLILTLNPTTPFHWTHVAGIKGLDPESLRPLKGHYRWYVQHWVPTDNPYLSEDTIESLEGLTGVQRKRFFEGEYASSQGLVYPEFQLDSHAQAKAWTKAKRYIVGLDSGFSPDPMVLALLAVMDTPNGVGMHLCGLFKAAGKDMSCSIGDAMEQWRQYDPRVVCDPSAGPAIVELRARGWKADPGVNRLQPGIAALRDLIATGRFTVEPSLASQLAEEICQYELNPRTDLPMGGTPDHILDAIRYAAIDLIGSSGQIIRPTVYDAEKKQVEELSEEEQGWVRVSGSAD
jgi:hypothetical protein